MPAHMQRRAMVDVSAQAVTVLALIGAPVPLFQAARQVPEALLKLAGSVAHVVLQAVELLADVAT